MDNSYTSIIDNKDENTLLIGIQLMGADGPESEQRGLRDRKSATSPRNWCEPLALSELADPMWRCSP